MDNALSKVFTLVEKEVVVRNSLDSRIFSKGGGESLWLLNFRVLLLNPDFLSLVAGIFWEIYSERQSLQIGCIESAGIPLATALVLKGKEKGKNVNGFYIRKSRKYYGLQNIVEGKLNNDPIVLVDDLINSGQSFFKQIEILKSLSRDVYSLFSIVRFRDLSAYYFLIDKGIKIESLFTLGEFGLSLEGEKKNLFQPDVFLKKWKFLSPNPSYFHRVPKSAPVIDDKKVYFGSDSGFMWALDQETGKEVWKFRIYGLGIQGKTIFSSPAIHNSILYFGAYDGNFYALDTETGKKKWVYMDADWIGSSPAIAADLNLVYVGLEFGLWNKKGGIVALDTTTGKKKWEYVDMPQYTHSSPAYSSKYRLVVVGSNDGILYSFDAKNGKLLWKFQTGGEIKGSSVFDEKRGYVIFGSFDGRVYILRIKDGSLAGSFQTGFGIYSTPLVFGDYVYVSSLDKKIYCINLSTFDIEWSFLANGRILASPIFVGKNVYIGSNDGCFYEIDLKTGKGKGGFQTTERITNKAAYNPRTHCFFVSTYANELYCITKNEKL